jgi:hypothetical protein
MDRTAVKNKHLSSSLLTLYLETLRAEVKVVTG